MQDDAQIPPGRTFATLAGARVVIGLKLLVLVLFGPLLVSLVEHLFLGTRHFEESLERLGVHAFLGEIYDALGILTPINRLINLAEQLKRAVSR